MKSKTTHHKIIVLKDVRKLQEISVEDQSENLLFIHLENLQIKEKGFTNV